MVLSYTISAELNKKLILIEKIRRRLLLTPISPTKLHILQWETQIDRIFWSLNLSGNTLSRTEIINLLSKPPKKRVSEQEKQVLQYKVVLDWINENFNVTSEAITVNTIENLYKLIYGKQ